MQHALQMVLEHVHSGRMTIEQAVQKTSHAVAELFGIVERGYVREGYFADLVIVDPRRPVTVRRGDILYKCGWSPLEGYELLRFNGRAFLVSNLPCYGEACVIREYTTFVGDIKLDVWGIMRDETQVEESDRLFGDLILSDTEAEP